jgi:V/A-type H+/Na+-transporting ATPase subunit I
MLGAVPMVHMQIQVPSREAPAVTRHIAAQGLLHLIDIAHGRIAADAAPPGTRDELAGFRDLVRRIRRVAERLEIALPDPAGALPATEITDFADARRSLESQIGPIESAVDEAWRRQSDAREQSARAHDRLQHAERLRRGEVDVARLSGLRFTMLTLGLIRVEEMSSLAAVLAPAPFAIVPLDVSEGVALAAVAVPASVSDRLESSLRVVTFEPVSIADGSVEPDAAQRRVTASEEAVRQAADDLAALRSRWTPTLVDLARRAELGALLLQAQTYFAASGRYVVISGWIPEDRADGMSRAITAVTAGRAVVDVEKPEDMPEALASALRIPILYRNPLLLRPFQTLVQLYGVPSYGEIQPTAFFAVSFLLMFGLMFGDVGQGLVLFSAGYCLFRYLPRYLDYGILLMECGAASAVFGALYGSFFGIEGLLPVLWMEPIRDLRRFMAVAVGFGVLLVSMGLVLNIVNSWRSGERATALLGPRGVFGAVTYWILVVLVARAVMPSDLTVPVPAILAMAAVPVLLLVLRRPLVRLLDRSGRPRAAYPGTPRWLTALEGSVELVDSLFAFFANTISFVRVAAFAAVHAGVFIAMFALADTLARYRFGQPLGIVTIVVGNIVMIFLEGLTVSVQVLRLEYYEFFGKFFRGGGEPYRPLMLRKGGA